jgi:hypothetical protein
MASENADKMMLYFSLPEVLINFPTEELSMAL